MVSAAGQGRRPCGGLPFTSSKQQRWHYVAGQLHVWQDYSHGAGIFIIGQTTEARAAHEELAVESADGHRPWLLSECEMPKPDCSAEPGGQRRSRLLSPTHRASKTIWHEDFIPHLKKKEKKSQAPPSHPHLPLPDSCFRLSPHQSRLHCQAKTCSALSSAGNNNCFLHIFAGFCHGGVVFYTSLFLGSVDSARADWNLMLPLTSASPAVTVYRCL